MWQNHEYLRSYFGEKGSELEMDLRSRLSDKSVFSPEKEKNNHGSAPEEENKHFHYAHYKFKSQNQTSKAPVSSRGREILSFTSKIGQLYSEIQIFIFKKDEKRTLF